MQRIVTGFAVLLLTTFTVGCGGRTAKVSGVVTLDGNPVEGATVTFTPESGGGDVGGSYGKTDAQGRYSLKTIAGDHTGAAIGKHKVTISLSKSDEKNPEGAAKELIPARYNRKSELTYDVASSGTDSANFELKR